MEEEDDEDSGLVFFAQPNTHPPEIFTGHERFAVTVQLPSNAKYFFCTQKTLDELNEAATLVGNGDIDKNFFPVDILSDVPTAFLSRGYGHTSSPYYKAPYFLVFRTNQRGIPFNYHSFNDFRVAPSMSHIVALLYYDDNIDKFLPTEYMDLRLPFQNVITLGKTLEFLVMDSNHKVVQFNDLSQLFVSITTVQ